MHYDYYNEDESINDFIENEMQQTRKKAIQTISKSAHFINTNLSKESFITMFSYCWQDSLPVAENLAYELDLGKLDFLALSNDFDGFKRLYLNTYEEFYE